MVVDQKQAEEFENALKKVQRGANKALIMKENGYSDEEADREMLEALAEAMSKKPVGEFSRSQFLTNKMNSLVDLNDFPVNYYRNVMNLMLDVIGTLRGEIFMSEEWQDNADWLEFLVNSIVYYWVDHPLVSKEEERQIIDRNDQPMHDYPISEPEFNGELSFTVWNTIETDCKGILEGLDQKDYAESTYYLSCLAGNMLDVIYLNVCADELTGRDLFARL